MKIDFALEFIKTDQGLERLTDTLRTVPAFALDLETVDWWNRERERIALIQIAYRSSSRASKVAVIDALCPLDFRLLKKPLENAAIVKVIHNAGFDASRLAGHYKIHVAPVHDTMLAARLSRESKYSLKAQAAIHLGINLDKAAQKSDWSRRPLDSRQLSYAALDAHATLLLYQHQLERNLKYEYRPKPPVLEKQFRLPLTDSPEARRTDFDSSKTPERPDPDNTLSNLAEALLEIAATLPTRYSPDSLAVSLGESERTGLAGWIVDRRLGPETELDEDTIRQAITDLCGRGLLLVTDTRRLIVSDQGTRLWQKLKEKSA